MDERNKENEQRGRRLTNVGVPYPRIGRSDPETPRTYESDYYIYVPSEGCCVPYKPKGTRQSGRARPSAALGRAPPSSTVTSQTTTADTTQTSITETLRPARNSYAALPSACTGKVPQVTNEEDSLPSYPNAVIEFDPFPVTPKSMPGRNSAPQLDFSLTSLSRALQDDDNTDNDVDTTPTAASSTLDEDSTSVVATPDTVSRGVDNSAVSTSETVPLTVSDNSGSAVSTSEVVSRRVGEESATVVANPDTVLHGVGGGSVVSTEPVEPCRLGNGASAIPITETVSRRVSESGRAVSTTETVPQRVRESGRAVSTREMEPRRVSESSNAVPTRETVPRRVGESSRAVPTRETAPRQAAGAQARPARIGETSRVDLNRRRTLFQPVPLRALRKGITVKKAVSRTGTSLRDAFQRRIGTPSPLAVPRGDDTLSTVVYAPETTSRADGDYRSTVAIAEGALQQVDDGRTSVTTPKRVSWQLNSSQSTVPNSQRVPRHDEGSLESETRPFDEGQSAANTPQDSTLRQGDASRQLLENDFLREQEQERERRMVELYAKQMQYLEELEKKKRQHECSQIRLNLLNRRVEEMEREVDRLKDEKSQLHIQFDRVVMEGRRKDVAKTDLETKMTKLRDLFEQEGRCAICFSIVERPMTLDCGHSFCRRCFLDWKACRINLRVCSCPICRTHVKNFSPSRMLGNIVNGMRNVLMEEDGDTE